MTKYTILKRDDGVDGSGWSRYGEQEASSPGRALRALDVEEGVYVAVPARSWKPLKVGVEEKRTVTVEAA